MLAGRACSATSIAALLTLNYFLPSTLPPTTSHHHYQRGGGELLLAAPPHAAAAALPASLYPLLPAGGAPGRQILGAHAAAQQAARPVAAQLPGSAGVSLANGQTPGLEVSADAALVFGDRAAY